MSDFNIISAIQKMSGGQNEDKVRLLQCSVDSVDSDNRICGVTTITGSATLSFEAQLMAGAADGFLIEPKVGSMVYVLLSKYTLPFVVQYSDVTAYAINGDEFGGLVKVVELTQKLNALEAKVNSIITWGGTVTPPLATAPLTPTQQTEIENKTIKHGE